MGRAVSGEASAAEVQAARHVGLQLVRVRRRSQREFDIEVDYISSNPSIMRREWDRRSANDDVVAVGTAWFPLLFLRIEWDRSPARFTQLVRAAKLDIGGRRNAWASLYGAKNDTLLWLSNGVWACVKATTDCGKRKPRR